MMIYYFIIFIIELLLGSKSMPDPRGAIILAPIVDINNRTYVYMYLCVRLDPARFF